MAVSPTKGQTMSLEKVAPGLTEIFIELGWEPKTTDDKDYDLDSCVFLLGSNAKLISDKHLIFYNNLTSPDAYKSVHHRGNNITGLEEDDDEIIKVNLKKIPNDVQKIVITLIIYKAQNRGQTFGQIKDTFVRVVNGQTKLEAICYDSVDEYFLETALTMAEIYREDGEWYLNAVGVGYEEGLQALLNLYN